MSQAVSCENAVLCIWCTHSSQLYFDCTPPYTQRDTPAQIKMHWRKAANTGIIHIFTKSWVGSCSKYLWVKQKHRTQSVRLTELCCSSFVWNNQKQILFSSVVLKHVIVEQNCLSDICTYSSFILNYICLCTLRPDRWTSLWIKLLISGGLLFYCRW